MSKISACISGVLVTLAGVSGAGAQSNSPAVSGLELEEVVVTAEKRETNLQKTSISIQTYSGDQLKKEGKKRIDEIMEGVVGVQVQTSQVGSSFYMRGVESGGGGPPGGSPSQTAVAVLIDGVYQNRGEVVRGGTLDVAQVEVARGTQSTNLGASAIAGAVSIVSNQPVFEYQAGGTLEVGNYHLISTEGVLNVSLTDSQALRLAYSSNKRDGYISSGAGDSDLVNARLKYRWQATQDLNLVLTASHNNIGGNGVSDGVLLATGHWVPWANQVALTGCSPGMGTGFIQAMGCPPIFAAMNDGVYYYDRDNPWDDGYPQDVWPNNPFRHTNIDSYSADLNWNLGFGTLTVTPSVQYSSFKSSEPPRGTSWMNEDREQDTRQFEARLSSPGSSPVQWSGGLYYYWTNSTGTFANVLFPGAAGMSTCAATSTTFCYTWSNSKEGIQETKSAYANVSYPVLDTLRLVGGLRYSRDDKSFIATADGSNVGDINGATTPYDYTCSTCFGDASWSAVTYNAGVEYDVLPQSMLYAKYSTGYQPGALDSMNVTGAPKLELEQITLGIKNRFFDNMLQLNVEAFDTTYHNRALQGGIPSVTIAPAGYTATITCPTTNTGATATDLYRVYVYNDGSGCMTYAGTGVTVPKLKSSGVDLEINFLPTGSDRVDLSVEYLDSKYKSVPELNNPYPTATVIQSEATVSTTLGTVTPTQVQADALAAQFATQVSAYNGLTLQNSAEWSVNLSYQHEFQFSGGATLTPRLAASYKSKYWSASGGAANIWTINQALQNGYGRFNENGTVNLAVQPAYSLLDFFTTWRGADGKFTVTGYVRNIENEPILRNTNGSTAVTLSAPRTYGMTFSANF